MPRGIEESTQSTAHNDDNGKEYIDMGRRVKCLFLNQLVTFFSHSYITSMEYATT